MRRWIGGVGRMQMSSVAALGAIQFPWMGLHDLVALIQFPESQQKHVTLLPWAPHLSLELKRT